MKKNKSILFLHPLKATILLVALVLLLPTFFYAQTEKKNIKSGNEFYNKSDYNTAEKEYSKAVSKNKDSYKGSFNLGDAYYKQGKYEEAANQFQLLTHRATSKDTLAKAFHNLGNSLLKSKKYKESIDAYKNALKNNPNDEDTRYNLAYAQQYLQQQQQQQNKDKKDDKKEDKKDDKKEKQEQKNKEKKDKEKQEQQNQISKEDAQRILDALQNDEKNIQDKMKKEKVKGTKAEIDKDW